MLGTAVTAAGIDVATAAVGVWNPPPLSFSVLVLVRALIMFVWMEHHLALALWLTSSHNGFLFVIGSEILAVLYI